jgi:hypothetical protein
MLTRGNIHYLPNIKQTEHMLTRCNTHYLPNNIQQTEQMLTRAMYTTYLTIYSLQGVIDTLYLTT